MRRVGTNLGQIEIHLETTCFSFLGAQMSNKWKIVLLVKLSPEKKSSSPLYESYAKPG